MTVAPIPARSFWNSPVFGGVLIVAILMVLYAILRPVFATARDSNEQEHCYANLAAIQGAFHAYAADHDDRLPPAEVWMDAIAPLVENDDELRCATVARLDPKGYGYAMARELSAKAVSSITRPSETALVFDSRLVGRNACEKFIRANLPHRHMGAVVAALEGRVPWVRGRGLQTRR